MRRRVEDQHNSPDQVAEYVRATVALADECGLSDADRKVLLPTMLALISNKQLFYEEIGPVPNMIVSKGLG